ncbi:uncharacterized protein UDID_19164 [Ustilago sp. UG-2017a]|nr:uncharacterized protein UDID_19164 [Ustilago sp. UG-2017a]
MTDQDLNSKLDRLLALMEAQLELSRQSHREERLRRAHLTEEATDLSHSEDQAGGEDESMIGDPNTPTPAPRPRRSVSFNLSEHAETNYEKYASPTGPKYLKTRVDPYSRSQMDSYVQDQEEEASIMAERSKPVATPFPKFNPRDIEIYILEAEAWFRFNQVYEHTRMINHLGSQLEVQPQVSADLCGHSVQRWLGTISIDTKVKMTPRSGVSADGNEVDDVGDEVIPGPQWTTAFGSIYIRTANLLWAPSDVR